MCMAAPPISTFKKCTADFKRGRESVQVDSHKGRPKSATTTETALYDFGVRRGVKLSVLQGYQRNASVIFCKRNSTLRSFGQDGLHALSLQTKTLSDTM